MSTGETAIVDFKEEVLAQSGSSVFPRSYADLGVALGADESRFYWMQNNVSPIYRYTAYLADASDREPLNDSNSTEKLVRYYLKKSDLSAILSVQNTTLIPSGYASNYVAWLVENRDDLELSYGLPALKDSVSSYLNYRNLVAGFATLGIQSDSLGYDLFDRNA